MEKITNEYRILFKKTPYKYNFEVQRVFIFADNHAKANEIVMNTWDIPSQWIVANSLWRKAVKVIAKHGNVSEVLQ
jgi:hypothetical protein